MPELIWRNLSDAEKDAWFARLLRAGHEAAADRYFEAARCLVCGACLDEPDPQHPHYRHG